MRPYGPQQPVEKGISFCQNAQEQFPLRLPFSDFPDKGRRNWNALRPRGPFLFRSAGKGSKRGRFARHVGSGKMKPRSNPFGEPSQTRRFTSSQTHGKVRFCPTGNNSLTSHAVRFCGRCLGLPSAPSAAGYEADQKLCFFVHFFFS